MTEQKLRSAQKLLAAGTPPKEVANHLGVSIPTLYRWLPGEPPLAPSPSHLK